MNVLAIDTATDTLALALRTESHRASLVLQAGLRHSELLLPRIASLLEEAGVAPRQLDLLVCSIGPGSFTGIRIGLATAKGLALAAGLPLVGVSTLDGLARRFASFPGTVAAVNPSLRKRYYAGLYRAGQRVSDYLELLPDELADRLASHSPLLLTGAGAALLHARLPSVQPGLPSVQPGLPSAKPGLPSVQPAGAPPVLDAGGAATDPLGLLECGVEAFRARGERADEDPLPLYLRASEAELGENPANRS